MAITTPILATVIAADMAQKQASRQRGLQHRADIMQRHAQAEAQRIQMIERQRAAQDELRAKERRSPASTIFTPTDEEMEARGTDRTGSVPDRLKLARRSILGGF